MIAILVILTGLAGAAAGQPVRKNVNDLTASEVLSLRRGVEVMMARNGARRSSADFRRSWQFWSNVHGHFGPDCDGPVSGAGMTGVATWRAQNSQEKAVWCSCQHGSDAFLTWHRPLVDQFEQVLQQASGDPSLMLPFWDYATAALLPQIFRDATYVDAAGATKRNPLRVEARRAALNTGAAGIAANTASAANAMTATSFSQFRTRFEQTPHNAVHCTIGVAGCGSGLMGAFATAASDPIFWLHHANIDRLYECWLNAGEDRLPTGSGLLNQVYSFSDRNGNLVRRRVRDSLTAAQLGYSYAPASSCPAPQRQARPAAEVADVQLGITTTAPVEFEAAPDGRVTLVIAALKTSQPPGAMFEVYLLDRWGGTGVLVDGVIEFFGNQFRAGDGEGHVRHGSTDEPVGRRFEFDVTDAVEILGISPGDTPTLRFEATTGLDNSTPETSGLNPEAVVTYRRAWLQVE
ncbi:MAG: tyrosinase family protein [Rhodobacteraceae bacterium]|nr:tyrosinase family protein [Paracoccaceae bacterium]